MHCEFCDIGFADLATARKHILSVTHIRAKQSYDLARPKFIERMRQKTLHPKDFYELTKLINIHSRKDILALYDEKFFKIASECNSLIACALFRALHQSMVDYRVGLVPDQVRQPFLEAVKRHRKQEDRENQ